MRTAIAFLAAIALVAVTACDKGGEKSSGSPPVATSSAASAAGPVDVPADGKKFDPPVKPEQLPAGAWYCDMGTVHWAQMKEGDKTCPICKMDLKQKSK